MREAESNTKEEEVWEKVLKQFWTSYVGDVIDVRNLIHTNAEFSYAMAVMDRTKGRIEESLETDDAAPSNKDICGTLAAC